MAEVGGLSISIPAAVEARLAGLEKAARMGIPRLQTRLLGRQI